MLNRAYHHVNEWECVAAGMYQPHSPTIPEIHAAVKVLSAPEPAMRLVVEKWPVSCAQVFTDPARNRRAWLGRACVFMQTGLPEAVTRAAWYLLTYPERDRANRVADTVISDWERDYTERTGCQRPIWG